jgi:CheY-like chemotaxis protein
VAPGYVLVVEDDLDMRDLLTLILNSEGSRVRPAANGAAALAIAVSEPPTLVVTDLRMPEMDGLDLLRALRERPELASIPVVVYTAYGIGNARVTEAASLPGVEVVLKGDLTDLRRAVRRLVPKAVPAQPAAAG